MKTLKHHAERSYAEFLRELDGKGQEEFAVFCGFSISGYSQFIHQKRNGSPMMFKKIAEAHKMSYKQFKEDSRKYYEAMQSRKAQREDTAAVSVAEMLSQILCKLGVIEREIQLLKSTHDIPTGGAAANDRR